MRFVSLSPRAFFRRRRRCCRRHHRGISKYISNAYKFDRANAHSLTKEMITIINGLTSSSSSKKREKHANGKKCVYEIVVRFGITFCIISIVFSPVHRFVIYSLRAQLFIFMEMFRPIFCLFSPTTSSFIFVL